MQNKSEKENLAGQILGIIMESNGLSYRKLGKITGIDHGNIGKIMRGELLKMEHLSSIAMAYGNRTVNCSSGL